MLSKIEVRKRKQKEMNILKVLGGIFGVVCSIAVILEIIVSNPVWTLVVFGIIYFVNKWIQFLSIIAFIMWRVHINEWTELPLFEIIMILMYYAMYYISFPFIDALIAMLLKIEILQL